MKKFPLLVAFVLAVPVALALTARSGHALDVTLDVNVGKKVGDKPTDATADGAVAKVGAGDHDEDEDDDEDDQSGGEPGGMAVAIIVPLAFFLSFVAVVGGSFYTRFRIERQKHETLRLIVEKGGVIPPELLVPPMPRNRDLRRGVLLSCLGVGISIFFAFTGPQGIGLGVIPLLVGLGYLLIWKLDSRRE